jgi:Fic family protein
MEDHWSGTLPLWSGPIGEAKPGSPASKGSYCMEIGIYHADNELLPRLWAAEAEHAQLAAAGAFVGPAAHRITAHLRNEVIYQSARLQGNRMAITDMAAVLAHEELPEAHPEERQEVENLAIGLSYIEMLAAGDMPLTERLIRVLHAVVMRGLTLPGPEAGAYRTDDLLELGYPVPAAVEVVPEMGSFARWLLLKPDSPEYIAGLILRATYAHTRLLHIHPFLNGNGRTARLVFNLLLLRAGFPFVAFAGDQRAAYLRGLSEASQQGDITLILGLVLDAVERSLTAYRLLDE